MVILFRFVVENGTAYYPEELSEKAYKEKIKFETVMDLLRMQ